MPTKEDIYIYIYSETPLKIFLEKFAINQAHKLGELLMRFSLYMYGNFPLLHQSPRASLLVAHLLSQHPHTLASSPT